MSVSRSQANRSMNRWRAPVSPPCEHSYLLLACLECSYGKTKPTRPTKPSCSATRTGLKSINTTESNQAGKKQASRSRGLKAWLELDRSTPRSPSLARVSRRAHANGPTNLIRESPGSQQQSREDSSGDTDSRQPKSRARAQQQLSGSERRPFHFMGKTRRPRAPSSNTPLSAQRFAIRWKAEVCLTTLEASCRSTEEIIPIIIMHRRAHAPPLLHIVRPSSLCCRRTPWP